MVLQETEQNNVVQVMCPRCSKMHQKYDQHGELLDHERCTRRNCRCPMDPELAAKFIEDESERMHDPKLAEVGKRMRNEIDEANQPVSGGADIANHPAVKSLETQVAGLTAKMDQLLDALNSRQQRNTEASDNSDAAQSRRK